MIKPVVYLSQRVLLTVIHRWCRLKFLKVNVGIIVKRYLMLVDIQKNSSYLDCKLANFEFSLVEINTY